MSLLKEFRSFVERGNVIDLAVAVIIGGAFGKIISAVVADVLMPPIGLIVGGVNFTSLKLAIGGKPEAPVTLNYGNFLQATFDFLIVAFCVFLLVKMINSLQKKKEEVTAAPPAPPDDVVLLREIRDLLKQGK